MVQRRGGSKGKGDRLRIAVLMGGPSREHDVSMDGGRNVVAALPGKLFEVRPVVIGKDGFWRMPPRGWEPPRVASGRGAFDPRNCEGWRAVPGTCEGLVALREWRVDVVVPVLHGRFGEDGIVQACLTAAGIRFVGSDAPASALAFDKVRAKQIFSFHGIDTPAFEVVAVGDLAGSRGEHIEAWVKQFGLPLVLKNPRGGSTLEVRLAEDEGAAISALEDLAASGQRILVEEYVRGRELTVGVIEDRDSGGPKALPVVEIQPRSASFFDYHEKYAADGAREICPADLPAPVAARAEALALQVHEVLGLRGLSRTDMILSEGGDLRVLEVNTLPGMTERGLVPLSAAASGLSFAALVERLVRTAHLPRA